MSTFLGQCVALVAPKSGPSKRCPLPAVFGQYCGMHSPERKAARSARHASRTKKEREHKELKENRWNVLSRNLTVWFKRGPFFILPQGEREMKFNTMRALADWMLEKGYN